MQRGQIFQQNGSWWLRYREPRIIDGQRKIVRAAVKLATIGEEHPSKRSVLLLADKVLAPLNTGQTQAESALTVVYFVENFYLPWVEKNLRASTYKNYKVAEFERHLKARLADIRLRDFKTVHGQRIIRDILEKNPAVGHKTGQRIKSFLSGAFKHARREGYLDTTNPMVDVQVPGRPKKFIGGVYTISELDCLSQALAGTSAALVVAVAAFTGLRLAEIRGLRWEDFDGLSLSIRRSVWRNVVNDPKTQESESRVPVLPLLQGALERHRAAVKGKPHEYIFAGPRRGAPLNLANLVRRVIGPALEKWNQENEPPLTWKGWHGFRRGLASNLYALGVSPKVIQAILRHGDIGTTLEYYVRTPDEEMRTALQGIENWFKNI